MSTQLQRPVDEATQLARLQQFLTWLTPIIFGFAMLYLSTAIIFQDLPTAVNSGIIFSYGCLLLIAWSQLRRDHTQMTVLIICGGLLGAALVMAFLQPALYSNLAIVPVLVVAVALPYTRGRYLRRLIIVCWLVTAIIALVGKILQSQSQLPEWLLSVLGVSSLIATVAFILLLLWQFSTRLTETIRTQESNTALQAALAEVEARAAAQERLLMENEVQRATIRELSAPVLPISRTMILLPLIGALDSERLLFAQEQVLNALHHSSARLLILDITGVLVVDTQVARGLISLNQAVRLLGAEMALVGIRVEVAQTIVNLGLDLQGLRTYRNLEMLLMTQEQAYQT